MLNQDSTVDLANSELVNFDGYDIVDAEYDGSDNTFHYDLKYNSIPVVRGVFVFRDVQYILMNDVNGETRLYFNEFQKDVEFSNDWLPVVNGKFEVNGWTYNAEDYEGGRFNLDGIWYVYFPGENVVKYAEIDDN